MKSKLIIVEGLPCSGKSTASKYIAQLLEADYYDEGCGNHPADHEFSAYLSDEEVKELEQRFPRDEIEDLCAAAYFCCWGLVVSLSKLSVASPELFEYLIQRKIYDMLPWEKERPVMLDKWRRFAAQAACEDRVTVMNCVLLQNPMCETMMRFNFDKETSREYIAEICEQIEPLSPIVIYLRNSDIASSIREASAERGGEWLDGVIEYHTNGGYGRENGLEGFEGYIAALEERQRRELDILRTLPLKSLVLDDPQKDWDCAYAAMRCFVGK